MKNMKRKLFVAATAAALLLTACAAPSQPVASRQDTAQTDSSASASSSKAAKAKAPVNQATRRTNNEPPEKVLPGCRPDLPHPLVLKEGSSTATDFSRWTASDIDGNPVTQDILKTSRITLVCAWSSYCSACVSDLEALQEIYEAYPRTEVNVIGIVASAQEEDGTMSAGEIAIAHQLQEITGATYMQLLPSDDLISIRLKNLQIVPESFLLDRDGNVIGEAMTGGHTAEEFRSAVDLALQTISQEENK